MAGSRSHAPSTSYSGLGFNVILAIVLMAVATLGVWAVYYRIKCSPSKIGTFIAGIFVSLAQTVSYDLDPAGVLYLLLGCAVMVDFAGIIWLVYTLCRSC